MQERQIGFQEFGHGKDPFDYLWALSQHRQTRDFRTQALRIQIEAVETDQPSRAPSIRLTIASPQGNEQKVYRTDRNGVFLGTHTTGKTTQIIYHRASSSVSVGYQLLEQLAWIIHYQLPQRTQSQPSTP